MFKLQHPKDLVTRMYMIEYLKELKAEEVYKKMNKYQKEKFFYLISAEGVDDTLVDYNYHALLFIATLHELESILMLFQDEVFAIEEKREPIYEKKLKEANIIVRSAEEEKRIQAQLNPIVGSDKHKNDGVSINLFDMARAEVDNSKKDKKIIV